MIAIEIKLRVCIFHVLLLLSVIGCKQHGLFVLNGNKFSRYFVAYIAGKYFNGVEGFGCSANGDSGDVFM
jgi:hypothetical protein